MLVLIWGTRPESLKLGPIAACLRSHKIPFVSLATGQHTTLLSGTPAETDLADSQSLGITATGDVMRWSDTAFPVVYEALSRLDASLVVVQGDTMSAAVGARAAQALDIPVAHVEAGVRSHDVDNPWPEERLRREITQLATYHFAPTGVAWQNLVEDGVPTDRISLTGNPIVSAIARYSDAEPVSVPELTVLFTMHRREWLLSGIKGVLEGFLESARTYPELTIVWPVHPGIAKHLPDSWVRNLPENVKLSEPLAYRPTMRLLARSLGLATDSGGLTEEAATLGVPTAVLRYSTDRPEALISGIARLFPPTTEGIIDAFKTLRDRSIPRKPQSVYGTPESASTIVKYLSVLTDSARSQKRSASSLRG